MAAGHGGDGVTLAPVTGKLISELIIHGTEEQGN
jgi:glycine/D-amino acid oxidase-like deaminating enzyme